MMKKVLLAAVAATLVSSPSFAGYISSVTSPVMTGNISVTGYNPAFGPDLNPNTYQVILRDLDGTVDVNVPPGGLSNYNVEVNGSVQLDIAPGLSINRNASDLNIFSGFIDILGIVDPDRTFVFNKGTVGSLDTDLSQAPFNVPLMNFGITYDGVTSNPVLNFLNAMLAGVGLPTVQYPNGSGSLDIVGKLFSDGAILEVTEIATNWPGAGAMLVGVDSVINPLTQLPVFGAQNIVDADFTLRNFSVTATAVPEPTTLALLGLGLMGLGLSRRRAV